MSSETEWLDDLISSHKKKLEEIRQWGVSYPNQHIPTHNQTQTQSQLHYNQYSNPTLNNTQKEAQGQMSIESNQTKKVIKQKAKIKSLKTSLNLLSEENASLKNQLIHLDNYNQFLAIDQKKSQYDQNNQINNEHSLLIEISHLKETIKSLESKNDKMVWLDNLKTRDIELLNQKVKDLEIIAEETASNANYELNKLTKDNDIYRAQLNEVDKVFEVFNYFAKRMSSLYPNDIPNEQIPYLNIKEYQSKLIQIENCIVNDKNKMEIELKGLDDEHYNKMMLLNKKIDQLTIENRSLEEKINEAIIEKANAKGKQKNKKEKENRSTSSKAKQTPRTLSKSKSKNQK